MSIRKARLSPAEWEVIDVVWTLGGNPSVREVLEAAYPKGEKAYTTVQTVMNKLVQKGFLRKEKIGLVNFYSPIRSRIEVVKRETDGFVDRVFNGSVKALASHLIQLDKLTEDEIADLKELVEEKERGLKHDEP